MAKALSESQDAEIVAVASRSREKADLFGQTWNISHCYGNYESLVADPDVDVVYIATPHNLHYENMLMCLNAGKHVLCEKAFTLNAQQAEKCIGLAREKGLFLMEAMWMRFFPAMGQVRTWLQEGRIGDIHLLQADFCLNIPFDANHRLYDLQLGGGALLDLGIYPLSIASMILGQPQSIQSYAHVGRTGVDELDTMLFAYDVGASAVLSCSLQVYKPREAFIMGTDGYIKIHNIFFKPDRLTLHLNGQEPSIIDLPYESNGYIHEINEVHACLRDKKTESPLMPLDETLAIMRLMDGLREKWGVSYPEEK